LSKRVTSSRNSARRPAKAAELRWPTFSAILKARFAPYELPVTDLTRARTDFLKLSVPTARRMLRFWLVRGAAAAGD
jgi:hypothetical protein